MPKFLAYVHLLSCLQVKHHVTSDDGLSFFANFAILLTIGYLPGMKVDVIPVIQAKGVIFQCPKQYKFLLVFYSDFLHRACPLAKLY